MPKIQAGTDPHIPYPRNTFWFWETVNIAMPIIGVLFLEWSIFGVVYLFWWELICWGGVGILKILSANGAKGTLAKIWSRIEGLLFFVPLYAGLLLIVIAFTLTELDLDTAFTTTKGLGTAMILIAINFLIEYVRSEIFTGRFVVRFPIEILFERLFYALPLSCLVLFIVIPLANKFEGFRAMQLIAIGIILSKFLMDLGLHYLPGVVIDFSEIDEKIANDDGSEVEEREYDVNE